MASEQTGSNAVLARTPSVVSWDRAQKLENILRCFLEMSEESVSQTGVAILFVPLPFLDRMREALKP